jgi:hypothetical protein
VSWDFRVQREPLVPRVFRDQEIQEVQELKVTRVIKEQEM